ncbi:Bcr/CflA family efflux MFS transporter [Pelistega ratti]|uniref:Bcr/CflA family efflux MFS transporter n=1 Tax=Pelistega ratti TaxID=2652177 RepID=UPI0013581D6A|nr:Bcr/CflA family efflux MFS transporter [Pelistega ratti]
MQTIQIVLKKKGLFLLLILLGLTGPFSIDMYLAAFPLILKDLQTTPHMLSFTLIGFSLFMAIGMLLMGTLSDKFGRKPILLIGLGVYIISSLGIVFTPNIELFIVFRIAQAFGAGGMVSVPMAIIKDSFSDEERTRTIATLQMFTVLGPTIAPVLGAQLIKYFSWHASFIVLAFVAIISLLLAIFFQETLSVERRLKVGVFQSILSLKEVIKNKSFMLFLFSTAMTSVIFMGYLAISSYIYIAWFSLSETSFSFYFAANSMLLVLGPKTYLIIKKRYKPSVILRSALFIIFTASILTATIGQYSPLLFLICFAPVALSNSFMRSFATDVLLGQPEMNAGASASMISFIYVALGSIGMFITSAVDTGYVITLGIIGIVVSIVSFILVHYYTRYGLSLKGFE